MIKRTTTNLPLPFNANIRRIGDGLAGELHVIVLHNLVGAHFERNFRGICKRTIHLHYPPVKRLMARQQTESPPFTTLYTKRYLISTLYIRRETLSFLRPLIQAISAGNINLAFGLASKVGFFYSV